MSKTIRATQLRSRFAGAKTIKERLGRKYFAYYAETFHRIAKAYIAIAKPLDFTALAFFPTFSRGNRNALLVQKTELKISIEEPGWWGDISKEPRIDLGCPFKVDNIEGQFDRNNVDAFDIPRNRQVWIEGNQLMSETLGSFELVVVHTFERIASVEIEPPSWAKVW